jgi:hypothetical protein
MLCSIMQEESSAVIQPPVYENRSWGDVAPDSSDKAVRSCLERCLRESFQSIQRRDDSLTESIVSEEQIHSLSSFIQESMSTPCRLYHNVEHLPEVLQNLDREIASCCQPQQQPSPPSRDPISSLAILFHDLVYYSLDQNFSNQQSLMLQNVILRQENHTTENSVVTDACADTLTLLPFSQHQDFAVSMVAAIFEVKESEELPAIGKNEFLSALLAVRSLGQILSMRQLLQLVVAIEATIPFRPIDTRTGKTPMDRLYDRTLQAYEKFVLGQINESEKDVGTLPDQKVAEQEKEAVVLNIIQQAVLVANSDLGVFCDPDPTVFFDSNWRLFPEWFPPFLLVHSDEDCPLVEFQKALASVRQRKMDPSRIFVSFREFPSPTTMDQKRQFAGTNLSILQKYLSIRLLTVTMILELSALAGFLVSSDDTDSLHFTVPLSSLSVIENGGSDDDLPKDRAENWFSNEEHDSIVFRVLKEGRRVGYPWDAAHSHLSAGLFLALGGSKGVAQSLLTHSRGQADADMSEIDNYCIKNRSMSWLQALPRAVVLRTAKQGFEHLISENDLSLLVETIEGWQ